MNSYICDFRQMQVDQNGKKIKCIINLLATSSTSFIKNVPRPFPLNFGSMTTVSTKTFLSQRGSFDILQ